jgi:hypothetical protein
MKAIKIEWKGETLTINETEAFDVGERIEEIVTLAELAEMGNKPKFHKLARCYAEMINFAGGNTTPREIHSEMMGQMKGDHDGGELMIAEAIASLISILMDGAPESDGEESGKKTKAS